MTGAALQGTARWLAVGGLVFNAFTWGVSWWPFRQLGAQGLHPLWLTGCIYSIAVGVLLLARPAAGAHLLRTRSLWWLVLASGGTNACFNWGVSIGDVVRVVLLFYLMPAWSVLLAWPLLGERPTAAALLRLVLALAGVGVVLQAGHAATGWPVPRGLPDWLALTGGFCFALTNILLLKLNRVPGEARVLAMFGGGAVMSLAAAGVVTAQGLASALPAPGMGWIALALALGLFYLAGNLALQYGAARLAAHTTALVMLSEVVFASASSVALGAAQLTAQTLAGGALILAAAAWSAWPRQHASQPSV